MCTDQSENCRGGWGGSTPLVFLRTPPVRSSIHTPGGSVPTPSSCVSGYIALWFSIRPIWLWVSSDWIVGGWEGSTTQFVFQSLQLIPKNYWGGGFEVNPQFSFQWFNASFFSLASKYLHASLRTAFSSSDFCIRVLVASLPKNPLNRALLVKNRLQKLLKNLLLAKLTQSVLY